MKKGFYLSSLLVSCFMLFSIAANAAVPVVTVNPVPVTVCSGAVAKFSVLVTDTTTGATPIVYSWQVSTDGGTTWSLVTNAAPYSHATTDTLYITSAYALNGYQYRSIDSNNDGADTSLAALLTVDTLNAGVITGPSAVCAGSYVTLSDAVTGGVWSHINHIIDTLSPSGVDTGYSQGTDTIKYIVTNTCGTAIAVAHLRVDIPATALPITGPNATCVGHSIDLMNANVLGTGTWSVSNTTATISGTGVLMGASQGLDTAYYAFTNGCNSVLSSAVIEIDTILGHGVISGPSGVCAGSWISLSDAVTGGIWLSSASGVAVVDGSGNVTGVSAGTTVISYLLSNSCGASAATDTITGFAPANAISTTPDSVGIDSVITLTNSTPGGTWSVASASIATVDSVGIVKGIAAGSTTVSYAVTNLCGTSLATITIYVGGLPSAGVISGPDSVCQGSTITLLDSVSGGVWGSAGDTTATGALVATINSSTGVFSGLARGNDIVSYTVHNAFGTHTVTRNIFVDAHPILHIVVPANISVGQNYTIKGYPYGGTFSVSTPTIGAFILQTAGSDTGGAYDNGSYVQLRDSVNTIYYSYTNACGTADSTFVISLITTNGVNIVNNDAAFLNVYPNPNQGEFKVNLISANTEPATITVTNIVGEKVKELVVTTNTATNIKLDQPAGIYFLSANTASGRYTSKITITK